MNITNTISASDNITISQTDTSKVYKGHLIARKYDTYSMMLNMPKFWFFTLLNIVVALLTGMNLSSWPLNGYIDFMVTLTLITLLSVFWFKKGIERITLTSDCMIVENKLYFFGWKKKYKYKKMSQVKINVKYKEEVDTIFDVINVPKISGRQSGYISFKYGEEKCEFGNIFSPVECYEFRDLLKKEIEEDEKNQNDSLR